MPADQRDEIVATCRALHNDICILYDSTLVRLVGFFEDEKDYYYRVREMGGRGEYLASCVGHIVSLRGIYPADRYAYMDDVFGWNGAPKSDVFVVEVVETPE